MMKNQNSIQSDRSSFNLEECLPLDLNSFGAPEDTAKNIPTFFLPFLFVFAVSIFFSNFSLLFADSLWKDKDPYSYPKTIQPGTVVKVVLKNGLRVEYESEYKATFDNDIKTVPDKKLVPDLPAYNSNSTYMRSKVGKSKSQGKVVGVMAVLVTGIDPGTGNLELEGSKVFNLSEERINLRLSGTISPEDLDKNRFISSDLIANLRVEYQGTLNPKELTNPNIQMKRITNPDGTVTEKAELSEQEKQEIILKNIKRLLGESE
ncbi:endoflagellar basal body L-ring protein [Leptospira congkakensis]|uniref:Endoflagellar basal body L-ring protein n=1 Tax=Leptospira congkakensis TaxID=2484932 RepID=A0A4Z1A7M6_9LEPT|nr:flagellar basal body L-ring protein FlgH [Leptospira congkakensis]TGL91015.1 endoflagellar basal body L-ring protein [Leptospira congkakensis]TGL92026.1 endoflagellar basal body L-ring protein [Leptospira congkakensis]TGL98742.1 endoflagellar basal body L-ring protein [Leptospira congkakensis]